jgi:hypothetical protein
LIEKNQKPRLKMRKPTKSRLNLALSGVAAVFVDQVLASMRSTAEEHSWYLTEANRSLEKISSD